MRIGRLDANGNLYILDSADDMVMREGRSVSHGEEPVELCSVHQAPVGETKRTELREPFRVARERGVAGD